MAAHSRPMDIGTPAPDFALPDAAGSRTYHLADFAAAPALIVAFLCNHCPYVKHMLPALVTVARDYRSRGVATVAISANDVETYPDDAPVHMVKLASEAGFGFPYLYDREQAVAIAYQAACTPDLYVFDGARRLAYHGQFDASRPGNRLPVTGADLRAALDAVLAGQAAPVTAPSVGCSIKWRSGRAPAWG